MIALQLVFEGGASALTSLLLCGVAIPMRFAAEAVDGGSSAGIRLVGVGDGAVDVVGCIRL